MLYLTAPLPEFILTQYMVSMQAIGNSSRNKIKDLASPLKGRRATDDKITVSNPLKIN
jgi:hypothetical protein